MGTPWMIQRREPDQKLSMPMMLLRWKELERESADDPEKQEPEESVLEPDSQSGIQISKLMVPWKSVV